LSFMPRRHLRSTLCPYTTLFRSLEAVKLAVELGNDVNARADFGDYEMIGDPEYTLLYYPHNIDELADLGVGDPRWDDSTALHGSDRKSTRLNSSHVKISYAVFCL